MDFSFLCMKIIWADVWYSYSGLFLDTIVGVTGFFAILAVVAASVCSSRGAASGAIGCLVLGRCCKKRCD